MKIALDYDDTYTRDPALWMHFIKACHASDHDIRIVTMRSKEQGLINYFARLGVPVIFTSLMQKREYCDNIGWHPDVWIDDSPEFIVRRDILIRKPSPLIDETGIAQQRKWNPIKTAPERTWLILVHSKDQWIRFGIYYPEMRRWYYSGTNERSQYAQAMGDEPTHWMNIPEVPKD